MTTMIARPDLLRLRGAQSALFYGCDQDWFSGYWQRKAGCGACTGANILYYLAQQGYTQLPFPVKNQKDFVQLMDYSWQHLTPGLMGLHDPARMQAGLNLMLQQAGSAKRSRLLEVPGTTRNRPSAEAVADFIRQGLQADSPVAFLNLHQGSQRQLESWHWVTVVGLTASADSILLEIYDNGNHLLVNLGQWLATSLRGGGFVYAE